MKISVKIGVMGIKLGNGLIISKCNSRSDATGGGFDNRIESIIAIDAMD